MKSTDPPIVVEQIFHTPIKNVWNAITLLEEMKEWYFEDIDAFKPEVGFQTQFEVQVEDRKFTHLWKVTEAVPLHKLTYTWKYEEYPGDGLVTFELMEGDDHVKLRLSLYVTEDFPAEIPEFSRESCTQGWRYFIGQRLKGYLER